MVLSCFYFHFQVRANSNNSIDHNLLNEQASDNVHGPGPESVKLSTPLVMENKALHVRPCDGGRQKKLKKFSKCQIRNLPIGLKFFKASLGLRKKKHKKSKRRMLDTKTLSKELLLDENCSSDVGPTKSENASKISTSSYHSRKKAANGTAQKNVKICNGDSMMNDIDGELRKRIHQNGAVLATKEQLPKQSDSVMEANQQDATETIASKDSRNKVLQEGMSKLTRGLEETTSKYIISSFQLTAHNFWQSELSVNHSL